MRYYNFYMADEEEKNSAAGIPVDDGHQMSQEEIDALIAALTNQ